MPTESFQIADSQDLDYNGGITGARLRVKEFRSVTENDVIDNVRQALEDAGWIQVSTSPARCVFVLPYGLPYVTEPEDPVIDPPESNGERVLEVQGIVFRFYDPFREIPGALPGVWLPAATTLEGSVDALTGGIIANTAWTLGEVHYSGASYTIELIASIHGTSYNSVAAGGGGDVEGVPYYSTVLSLQGGGWIMRSTLASEEWLEVWIYAGDRVFFEFRCSMGEVTPPTFYLTQCQFPGTSQDAFTIVANQFQFAIFRAKSTDREFLFASQPYLQHGTTQAVLIIGNGQRGSLGWRGGANTACAREGQLATGLAEADGPRVYVLRMHQGELQTSQNFNLISSAWAAIPRNLAPTGPRIVGKLWDAFVLSRYAELDDTMVFRELLWHCIARSTEFGHVPASLWIAYDDAPAV